MMKKTIIKKIFKTKNYYGIIFENTKPAKPSEKIDWSTIGIIMPKELYK